jgi:hypothetical protein
VGAAAAHDVRARPGRGVPGGGGAPPGQRRHGGPAGGLPAARAAVRLRAARLRARQQPVLAPDHGQAARGTPASRGSAFRRLGACRAVRGAARGWDQIVPPAAVRAHQGARPERRSIAAERDGTGRRLLRRGSKATSRTSGARSS